VAEDRAHGVVDYALSAMLACSAIEVTTTGSRAHRAAVDTATRDELQAALETLAIWYAGVVVGLHPDSRRAMPVFLANARDQAAHVIDTAGRCDCDPCRALRHMVHDCTCQACRAKKRGHR
jgi:hypothetical protein